jgi:transcriptional regulator NrdR family protein
VGQFTQVHRLDFVRKTRHISDKTKPVHPMKTLTIRISDALYAEIASEARSRNVPKSQIVRERLAQQDAVAPVNKASLWSRMEDLVILTDSLAADLSSNKAHLRRRKGRANWLDAWKKCPVSMGGLPPRGASS